MTDVEIEFAPTVEATSTRRDAYDETASVRAGKATTAGAGANADVCAGYIRPRDDTSASPATAGNR